MCTTKTDRQYNQTAGVSKKRLIGNAAASQLVFAFIFLLVTGMPTLLYAQLPISALTSGTTDYTIPAGFNSINVIIKGGAGGTCKAEVVQIQHGAERELFLMRGSTLTIFFVPQSP
jgi:hypothetical protein